MADGADESKTFRDLGVCEPLAQACENLGWKIPSKIQVEAIPHALQGKDVIGLAQTGSGKTGAFAIPILQALLEDPKHPAFFACVLSPTRELAIQIKEQFEALGSIIQVKCTVLVGGVDKMQQIVSIGNRPHIVVGTPGRLLDHLINTAGFNLHNLKYLVLDEADRLLNLEFEKAIDEILKVIPRDRRTYLFSATMTRKAPINPEETIVWYERRSIWLVRERDRSHLEVGKLQRACLKHPVKIEASSKYSTVDSLKQQFRLVSARYKDCYLVYILTEMPGSTSMVFTRTCESTRILALVLRNLGLKAIPISGQMSQPRRLGALNKFKAGDYNILICTDVASRGLDIPSVDMVINYDIPTNSKDDKFLERVRAAVEEDERQAAAVADTNATKNTIATAEESRKATQYTIAESAVVKNDNGEYALNQSHCIEKEKSSSVDGNTEPEQLKVEEQGFSAGYDSLTNLPYEFYHYYHGSSNDMGKLIEVRRS